MPVPGDTRDLKLGEDVPFYDVPKQILQHAAGGANAVVHFVNDDRGPLLDTNNGGTGVEIGETLSKAHAGITNVGLVTEPEEIR